MASNTAICEDLQRAERINAEIDRISVHFDGLRDGELAVIDPLIRNAAFMRITLEDLQKLISSTGVIEEYQNGQNQRGMKQSAALQSYNSTIKNYAAVIKRLTDMLPPEKRMPYEPPVIDPEEEQRLREERDRKNREDFDCAVRYQQRQRELADQIAKASSLEERERLTKERNTMKLSDFRESR